MRVEICKSCLKDCGHKPKKFRKAVEQMLDEKNSDAKWDVEIVKCLKVCPRAQIGFALHSEDDEKFRSIRTMTRSPSVEGVTEECLSIAKNT